MKNLALMPNEYTNACLNCSNLSKEKAIPTFTTQQK